MKITTTRANRATKIAIVDGRFYAHISDEMIAGAKEVLQAQGAEYTYFAMPGALEIPAAIAMLAAAGGYDGYLALGCVIRGQTSHYDLVCQSTAYGLQRLAVDQRLAVANGILTVENEAQALARAQRCGANRGGTAAQACLDMVMHAYNLGLLSRRGDSG